MAIEACGKSERGREGEKASSMGENIGKCFKGRRAEGKGRFSCHGVGNAANERNGVRSPSSRSSSRNGGSVQPLPNEHEAQVGNRAESIPERSES